MLDSLWGQAHRHDASPSTYANSSVVRQRLLLIAGIPAQPIWDLKCETLQTCNAPACRHAFQVTSHSQSASGCNTRTDSQGPLGHIAVHTSAFDGCMFAGHLHVVSIACGYAILGRCNQCPLPVGDARYRRRQYVSCTVSLLHRTPADVNTACGPGAADSARQFLHAPVVTNSLHGQLRLISAQTNQGAKLPDLRG